MTTGGTDMPFALRLREELSAAGLSVRELARRLAGPTGDVESERRSLSRYLAGDNVPQRARARLIAEALGLDRDALPAKEDQPRPARAVDLLAEVKSLTMELTGLLGRAGEGDVPAALETVVLRLEALEAAVAEQREETVRGLAALAKEVRALARRQARGARQPSQTKAAS